MATLSFREFLRSKGASFIHVKPTSKMGYQGVEFAVKKGSPSLGICFFSKAVREDHIPTDAELAANIDNYFVYETVTESGIGGYTIGFPPAEFTVNEGVEVTL